LSRPSRLFPQSLELATFHKLLIITYSRLVLNACRLNLKLNGSSHGILLRYLQDPGKRDRFAPYFLKLGQRNMATRFSGLQFFGGVLPDLSSSILYVVLRRKGTSFALGFSERSQGKGTIISLKTLRRKSSASLPRLRRRYSVVIASHATRLSQTGQKIK
jgi:hypothetical protein